MTAQPDNLFGNIGLIGKNNHFLGKAHRVNLYITQKFVQTFLQLRFPLHQKFGHSIRHLFQDLGENVQPSRQIDEQGVSLLLPHGLAVHNGLFN